jgi:tetratricopeptide (TPR) repeat protein
MDEAAGDAEKVAAAKAFLARFPDTEHTREVAAAAVGLLSGPLADPAGADAFLLELTQRVNTPETRTALLGMRLGTLAGRKDAAGLRAAVAEYTAGRELGYDDHARVFAAALECGDWDLAITHAEAALPFATPEAYRADNEKRKPSEQRVADFARRRKVGALAAMGWAMANQGRLEQALPLLAEAHDTDFHGYMGNTESRAGSYLGRALAMAGRHDEAERPLAVAALYGGDAAARDALRARFAATRGTEDGFEAWLGEARRRLARPVEDFTLTDYEGTPRTFSQLRNGEVTLLTFWFPT